MPTKDPVSAVFGALCDPTRRAILELLRTRPLTAGRIAADFPVSRPAISRHLRILKEAELVGERRRGRERLYELRPAALDSAVEHLRAMAAVRAASRAVAKPSADADADWRCW